MLLAGCHTDMWVQPKYSAQEDAEFFSNGSSARDIPAHTVARGHLELDTAFFTGAQNGQWVKDLPVKLTKTLLERGQDRFDVFCTPCHGQLGDGNGMISQRGFSLRRPVASYHTDRLRAMPIGHFYDVMTHGYGTMFSYASRIEPQDRWAIAAYIRVLQFSQHAPASDVPANEISAMETKKSETNQVVASK